jgi:predicted unusual protein kinase regulating ubiquinone biosynthesis (AarF/ABC1/UbiB family)
MAEGISKVGFEAVEALVVAESDSAELEFVTFDLGRKHLARVVAVNGKSVMARRFNKKTVAQTTDDQKHRQQPTAEALKKTLETLQPICTKTGA